MASMHKLVYKMYMDKIEEMERDKDEMKRLTDMLNNPNDEFGDDEEDEEEEVRDVWRKYFYIFSFKLLRIVI